jgi:chromosomal replication initiator protein
LLRRPVTRQGWEFALASFVGLTGVSTKAGRQANMSTDQDRWQRIRERLRFELGEDVFSSWFDSMELESVDKGVVRLSVATLFLRKWIQAHYTDRILAQWQVEEPTIFRLELSVRSAAIRPALKPKLADPPALPRDSREVAAQNSELRASGPFGR